MKCALLLILALAGITSAQPPAYDDNELVITYGGQKGNNCNNPLDHARILVAAADYLVIMEDDNGDPQVAPNTNKKNPYTCDKKFSPCNTTIGGEGGGCCSNLECKKTSNGLKRCLGKGYKPVCTKKEGFCTRGQPCCTELEPDGLRCQPARPEVLKQFPGQKQCLPQPKSRLRRLSEEEDEVINEEEGLEAVDQETRKLYNRSWGCGGRTCKRCLNSFRKNFYYCVGLCMFQCKKAKKRALAGEKMDEFLDDLKSYMSQLDFGDDCRVEELTFSYFIGRPGVTIA